MRPVPVSGEVPVHVDAANPIAGNAPIPVAIDSLPFKPVEGADIAGPPPHHDPGISFILSPGAIRVRNPHLKDATIAIQIHGRVRVRRPVLVLIERADGAPEPLVLVQNEVGAIGVELGADVEGACVQQGRDPRVLPVVVQQVREGVEGHLGAGQFPRMDPPIDVHGRFLLGRARGKVRYRNQVEVCPQIALPNDPEVGEVGVERRKTSQDLSGLRLVMIGVPVHRAIGGDEGSLAARGVRRRGAARQENESSEQNSRRTEQSFPRLHALHPPVGLRLSRVTRDQTRPARAHEQGRACPRVPPPSILLPGGPLPLANLTGRR